MLSRRGQEKVSVVTCDLPTCRKQVTFHTDAGNPFIGILLTYKGANMAYDACCMPHILSIVARYGNEVLTGHR